MPEALTASATPTFTVIERSIKELKPYAGNARVHSTEHVQKLAASIEEYGFTNPILTTKEGLVIAGHGRLDALKQLGWKKAPCIIAEGWTDAQVKAYTIMDNRSAEMSEWNMDVLMVEVNALIADGFDLNLAGIDDAFLQETLKDFKPELSPVKGGLGVTAAQVDSAQNKVEQGFTANSQQDIVDVICPHCGETFGVSSVNLKPGAYK